MPGSPSQRRDPDGLDGGIGSKGRRESASSICDGPVGVVIGVGQNESRMVLRVVPPSPDVAHCRWPDPHCWPDLDEHRHRWGLAAWEWMATWCPTSLAQIPDPVGYFTELDRLASAEEQRIHQALVRAGVDFPDTCAEEAVEAEWVRLPKEVETPVWEPTWPDLVKVTVPHFRDYGDGTFAPAFVEDTVASIHKLADDIVLLWVQDPDNHDRDGTLAAPAPMQGILDNQLTPLYRHLVWDLAAREVRQHHSHDARYRQLHDYPTPTY